jgi:hypothetical protein
MKTSGDLPLRSKLLWACARRTLNLVDAVARLPAINFEAPSFARYSRREQ